MAEPGMKARPVSTVTKVLPMKSRTSQMKRRQPERLDCPGRTDG